MHHRHPVLDQSPAETAESSPIVYKPDLRKTFNSYHVWCTCKKIFPACYVIIMNIFTLFSLCFFLSSPGSNKSPNAQCTCKKIFPACYVIIINIFTLFSLCFFLSSPGSNKSPNAQCHFFAAQRRTTSTVN